MKNLTRVLAVLVLVGAVGAAVLVPGGGSSPGVAQEEPVPEPHAIMLESTKLCTPLLIAFAGFDAASAAVACVSFDSEDNLWTIAAMLSQRDGKDTPIIDTTLTDDPSSPEDDRRLDAVCTGDQNDDGEVCGPGDDGVDDVQELRRLIDARDDGLYDGQYELRASDFASMDLDANQLHELDGTMIILVFNEGDDHPVRFRTPDDGGVMEAPGEILLAGEVFDDIACGAATVPGHSFFDEDCDDDNETGDGVKAVALVSNEDVGVGERGEYQLRITETDRETFLDYSVVGEGDDLSFTLLKTVATNNTPEDECSFSLSVAGVTEALGNPHIGIVLVHALDGDGTQVASTLLDWEVDPEELAFVFLPQTPTVDLGSFGKGFPQAICGDEGTGIATVTAHFSATITIDPNKPDFDDSPESFELTVLGEPASLSVVATPAEVACNGTASAELAVTVVDENGDNVADGTEVEFEMQVLGTANPIVAKTSAGVAKSTITPLAAVGSGAPVIITAGDVQTSFLVRCQAGSPQQPEAGGAAPTPGAGQPGTGITGPDTGSGGDAARSRELSTWPAVALFVAAMGLAGARFGLRRTL